MLDGTASARATWVAMGAVLAGVVAVALWAGSSRDEDKYRRVVSVMSSSHWTDDGRPFAGADVTAIMGSSSIDLRDAVTAQPEAIIDVFAMMGSLTIRVPSGWTIDTRAVQVMGGVRDRRSVRAPSQAADADAAAPRLVLRGVVMMGSILIRS
jgi:hypothetical protein